MIELRATLSTHPPRILLLYGSLRERSYSRFLTHEAERLLQHFGAETRIFDPHGLPLPDGSGKRSSRRCRSCGSSRSGPKARSGAARNATAP